jgi:hypothetical protein
MEDLLIVLLQGLFEFVFEVLFSPWFGVLDLLDLLDTPEDSHWWVYVLWLWLGATLGGLSLLVAPRSMIALPALRIANLVLAPIVSGLIAHAVARRRRRRLRLEIVSYRRAWQAVCFTLGLVVIRFAYATH